jgi:hypothetical protein
MGTRKGCPYNDENTVNMVRHNHKLVQFHCGKSIWDSMPLIPYNFTNGIQPHLVLHNFPEQTFPIMGANGYKIRPRLRIIVPLQSDGTAIGMSLNGIGHHATLQSGKFS